MHGDLLDTGRDRVCSEQGASNPAACRIRGWVGVPGVVGTYPPAFLMPVALR